MSKARVARVRSPLLPCTGILHFEATPHARSTVSHINVRRNFTDGSAMCPKSQVIFTSRQGRQGQGCDEWLGVKSKRSELGWDLRVTAKTWYDAPSEQLPRNVPRSLV
ncbi:hypothetical protein MGG_16754 [Pyricularia oryzae 70-15]|uniref:Uncharacterized protein n=4 Tax=Pyricularia oryzae TaxID=318829 RepID=G4N570_PYRO7|nr:uncharacterized protein MGG_16754 [Pyricularia oryzae 70-15]EHA52128.1 hypothetical protein MGG_16754 [Pyricularia oryzae 70-15]ELQ40009.1 hypothetical protein OOU_Y34scaffold00464g91 [Pyricularia oryzae Y34]